MGIRMSTYDSFWRNTIQLITGDTCYEMMKVDQGEWMRVKGTGYNKYHIE